MAYDLEELGSSGFQELGASLAFAEFGPTVQVMGVGRDGGRDMFVDGPITWTEQTETERSVVGIIADRQTKRSAEDAQPEEWTGYTVFQVKHKVALAPRPQDNATWLWSEIRKELDSWVEPANGRERTPRQLVFITTVALTPTPGTGGHDLLGKRIADYDAALADSSRDVDNHARDARLHRLRRLRRIEKIRFWDRNSLTALLNVHHGVRTAFVGGSPRARTGGSMSSPLTSGRRATRRAASDLPMVRRSPTTPATWTSSPTNGSCSPT